MHYFLLLLLYFQLVKNVGPNTLDNYMITNNPTFVKLDNNFYEWSSAKIAR